MGANGTNRGPTLRSSRRRASSCCPNSLAATRGLVSTHLDQGGTTGGPTNRNSSSRGSSSRSRPEASEALGETWGDTWGLFPVKLQPWLVRVLGPYCLTDLIGALRLALSKKDLGLPTLPLPRKSAEERLGRFRGGGVGEEEPKIGRLSVCMLAPLGSARARFCRTERQRKPRGLQCVQVIQGRSLVPLHFAALEPLEHDLQHMCLHLLRS